MLQEENATQKQNNSTTTTLLQHIYNATTTAKRHHNYATTTHKNHINRHNSKLSILKYGKSPFDFGKASHINVPLKPKLFL